MTSLLALPKLFIEVHHHNPVPLQVSSHCPHFTLRLTEKSHTFGSSFWTPPVINNERPLPCPHRSQVQLMKVSPP